MNSNDLINDKSMRDQLSRRIDVLDKVKNILANIPTTSGSTIQQVADFYEVEREAIRMIIYRNNDELFDDGLRSISGAKIRESLVNNKMLCTNHRGYFTVDDIKFANGNNLIFTRRSVLRIGMLLRDSEIAKEIRTQLLNIEEKIEAPIKIQDINEEERLALNLGKAYISGDYNQLKKATMDWNAFNQRHITQLETTNQSLNTENQVLAQEVLTWKNRDQLNKGIRTLAITANLKYWDVYNELYRELKNKHHIWLQNRGDKKPYIQYIKEHEWKKVMSTFAAMCRKYGTTVDKMINMSTLKSA